MGPKQSVTWLWVTQPECCSLDQRKQPRGFLYDTLSRPGLLSCVSHSKEVLRRWWVQVNVSQLIYQEGIWPFVSNCGNKLACFWQHGSSMWAQWGEPVAHAFVSPLNKWSQGGHFMPTRPAGSALAHTTPSLAVPCSLPCLGPSSGPSSGSSFVLGWPLE